MVNKNDLTAQLETLGLTPEQASLYLTLLTHRTLSPLELARETRLNRTSIYRYLEELESAGLVKRTLDGKSTRWTAQAPDQLELMLESKLAKIKSQQATLPPLIKSLSRLTQSKDSPTQIHHYQGEEGARQLLWNTLKSHTEMVGFGYLNWNYLVGKKFAEKLRAETIARRIKSRELINQVEEEFSYTDFKTEYPIYYQHRAIDISLLTINHDTYIYNNVYAVLQKHHGEVFGIEIVNQDIADSQRQLFDILWNLAKPS